VFSVISNTVTRRSPAGQLLWATFGGGLALWQVSGAVRAVMGAFDRIYGATFERPFFRRYRSRSRSRSRWERASSSQQCGLVLAPFLAVRPPSAAWDVFAFLARWVLGVGFVSLTVGLLVRVAPATPQPLPWVSLGTTIVTVWWVIVSLGFYLWMSDTFIVAAERDNIVPWMAS
jgi:uncharacterized BrkB/YihY/UPF0761 family membrane protein